MMIESDTGQHLPFLRFFLGEGVKKNCEKAVRLTAWVQFSFDAFPSCLWGLYGCAANSDSKDDFVTFWSYVNYFKLTEDKKTVQNIRVSNIF